MTSETISLIGAGAVALLSIICNIVSIVAKNKKQAALKNENEEITKQNTLMEILGKVPSYIKQAEQIFTQSGSGVAKKVYAKNLAQIDCVNKGIEYNENVIDYEIERILSTPQKKEKGNEKKENAEQSA